MGKSGNGGESAVPERTALARELEAAGHGGCAFDLEAADDFDVVRVAYEVAEHVEEACGDTDFTADPELAGRLREWADRQEKMDPAVAQKRRIPVFVHRKDGQLFVDLNPDDILDLADGGEGKVTVALGGEPVMSFYRMDTNGGVGN